VAKRARRSYSAADSMDVDVKDGGMEVDSQPTAGNSGTAKPTKKSSLVKKRRTAVFSSDEGDDEYDDNHSAIPKGFSQDSSPLPSLDLSDRDYDHDLPAVHSKPKRQKNPTWKVRDAGGKAASTGSGNRSGSAGKSGKGTVKRAGSAGGAKVAEGKGKVVKKEPREIMMKDERKVGAGSTPAVKRETSIQGQSKESQSQRSVPRLQVEMMKREEEEDEDVAMGTIVGPVLRSSPASIAPPSLPPSKKKDPTPPPTAPAPVPAPTSAPAPPKKVKLPTIRKNKPPGAATSTASQSQTKPVPTSSAATASTSGAGADKPPIAATAGVTPSTGVGARKTQATSDFDLRDKSAWASIFKQVCTFIQSAIFSPCNPHSTNSLLDWQFSSPLRTEPTGKRGGEAERAL
jgi:hypothetical protein